MASGRLVDTERGRAGGSARFPPPCRRVSLAAPACTGVQTPRREGSKGGPTAKIGAHRSSGRGDVSTSQALRCVSSDTTDTACRLIRAPAHTCYFLALTAHNVNSERRAVSGLVPVDCWAPGSLSGTQSVASKSTRNDKPSHFPRASRRRRGQPCKRQPGALHARPVPQCVVSTSDSTRATAGHCSRPGGGGRER